MIRRTLFIGIAFFVVVGLQACASAPSAGEGRNPNLITQAEIAGHDLTSAYQIVQRLRPQWLRNRGVSSFTGVVADPRSGAIVPAAPTTQVYLDGTRLGTLEDLHGISAMLVLQMERLGGIEATQRFGTGHEDGVILVTTR